MNLNDTFQTNTLQEWEAQITKDLKGESIASLNWNSELGSINPVLFDYKNKYARIPSHASQEDNLALNAQSFCCKNAEASNQKILKALEGGVNAIHLYDVSLTQLEVTFQNIMLDIISTRIFVKYDHYQLFQKQIQQFCEKHQYDYTTLDLKILSDPIGDYISQNNEKLHLDVNHFHIDGSLFANAGGSVQNQLGMILSIANEYLCYQISKGIAAKEAAQNISFTIAIGHSYFPELAKIRAFRTLWATLLNEYGVSEKEVSANIHCVTSNFYYSNLDVHNNLLRGTISAMASFIGGADSIETLPYDYNLTDKQSDSSRLAKNIFLILQEEAYLNQVKDASNGSYYIEQLTDIIIEQSWKIFQEIENQDGFIAAFEKGIVANKLSADLQEKIAQYKQKEIILIGTNKHVNSNEKNQEDFTTIENDSKFLKSYRLSQTKN